MTDPKIKMACHEHHLAAARHVAAAYHHFQAVAEHEKGIASHHKQLWTLLVFQLWHDNFLQ